MIRIAQSNLNSFFIQTILQQCFYEYDITKFISYTQRFAKIISSLNNLVNIQHLIFYLCAEVHSHFIKRFSRTLENLDFYRYPRKLCKYSLIKKRM